MIVIFAGQERGNTESYESLNKFIIGKEYITEIKFFQKRFKKYCGVKKRVLYLHPLSKETS